MKDVYQISSVYSEVVLHNKIAALDINMLGSKFAFNDGFIVSWLDYAVLFGKIEDGRLKFHEGDVPDFSKYLLRMRLFDENRELHVWRTRNGFSCRYRRDCANAGGDGEPVDFIDASQVMFGTSFKDKSDFIEISESRGIKYNVPKEFLGCVEIKMLNERKARLALHTRNYIGYNEIGQAGFVDSRFLKIDVCKETVEEV